jgi:hypothetical protein
LEESITMRSELRLWAFRDELRCCWAWSRWVLERRLTVEVYLEVERSSCGLFGFAVGEVMVSLSTTASVV